MQKQRASMLKKFIEQMQSSYGKVIKKLQKIIQNAGELKGNANIRVRRPVKHTVPSIFNEQDRKDDNHVEFFRRASLFHLLSNRLDVKITDNSLHNDNFNHKTIEKDLKIQGLMNKQLKVRIGSIKEENNRLKSLLEALEKQASHMSILENDRIVKILSTLKVIFENKKKALKNHNLGIEKFDYIKPCIKAESQSYQNSEYIEEKSAESL